MNEFLIKLIARFTGSGFADAEAGLKRVKAAADDAEKATSKAGRATAAPGTGKMFTPQESKDLARSIMQEAMEKAEAAEKALQGVENQAEETKAALEGSGGAGGGGGFLNGVIRGGAAVLAALAVGKILANQVDKISQGAKIAADSSKAFQASFEEAANASTIDGAVAGFKDLNAQAEAMRGHVAALRKDWGAWAANILTGGVAFREMEETARQMSENAGKALSSSAALQLKRAEKLAGAAGDPAAVDRVNRESQREQELNALRAIRDDKKNSNETKLNAIFAIYDSKARYEIEDQALDALNAKKVRAAELEQQIAKAANEGNKDLAYRLTYTREYNAALEKAASLGITDAEGQKAFAKAEADKIKKPEAFGPEPASYADKVAAEANKERREALDLEVRIAEAKAAGNIEEEKRLKWMKDYKAALEQAQAAGMGDKAFGFATRMANAQMDTDKARTPTVGVSDAARLGMAVGESQGAGAVINKMAEMVRKQEATQTAAERTAVATEEIARREASYG